MLGVGQLSSAFSLVHLLHVQCFHHAAIALSAALSLEYMYSAASLLFTRIITSFEVWLISASWFAIFTDLLIAWLTEWLYTVNRKNTTKCFLIYSLQNLIDCDKIWYMLSWVNLNVFRLTWIVYLPYLVKLSIRVLQVNSSQNCEPKNTPKCFCHIFYKTRLILAKFGTCFLIKFPITWCQSQKVPTFQ